LSATLGNRRVGWVIDVVWGRRFSQGTLGPLMKKDEGEGRKSGEKAAWVLPGLIENKKQERSS